MAETLGIMIHSTQSRDNLISLARAALARGKQVRIHLAGQAVRLLADAAFLPLLEGTSVSACRESLEGCGSQVPLTCPAGVDLIAPEKWAEALGRCNRRVVL